MVADGSETNPEPRPLRLAPAGRSARATARVPVPRLAEDVFHFVEKAGGTLGGLIFHFYGLTELLE